MSAAHYFLSRPNRGGRIFGLAALAGAVAGVCLFVSPSFAQVAAPARISGFLRSESGAPVPGAQVKIEGPGLARQENSQLLRKSNLKGRYELEVVDVVKNPSRAAGEQIIAAPTLVKKLPLPLRRFIGDLSETERILLGLDLRKREDIP